MSSPVQVKDDYTLAKCCQPAPPDEIVGYYSYDNVLKVHRADCRNLEKAEQERLVTLTWPDILAEPPDQPDADIGDLTADDIRVLRHHETYGVDYSLKMARMLGIAKDDVFAIHTRLREMGLLERVEPRIIQYRKGHVKNKWIKHRNHTYYDLTEKGRLYLSHVP